MTPTPSNTSTISSTAQPPSPAQTAPRPEQAPPHEQHARRSRWLGIGALLLGVIGLAGLYLATTVPRWRHDKELAEKATAAMDTPPQVIVVKARQESAEVQQTLPGNSQAFRETALYARANGYLKEWRADIGDRVKENQVIAVISAPDLDDQLIQAKANLEQARATLTLNEANAQLAETILERYMTSEKIQTGSIAQVLIDEQKATVVTSKASVLASQASIKVNEAMVQMYSDLQSYEQIVAPFAGVITARNVDPGALITADNPSASRELFHLMQTDPLRVFVDVPQTYSTGIQVGQTAQVFRPEEPGKIFTGKVTRTANALDPATRTLLVQVDVPNPVDALRPGMYLMVTFLAARTTPDVIIPSAAIFVAADGTLQVAVLENNDTVHYRKVQLGRDHGAEVEVLAGLAEGDSIIVHPGDALAEGEKVNPLPPPKEQPAKKSPPKAKP